MSADLNLSMGNRMIGLTRRAFLAAASLLAEASWAKPGRLALQHKAGLAGLSPAGSGLNPDWTYAWNLTYVPGPRPQLPMCWGWKGDRTAADLETLRALEPPLLFGFNEPDHPDQSNLDVETALEAWPNLQGIATELVSPSCADPAGSWMQNFMAMAEQRGFQIDAVGVHAYEPPDPDAFIKILERVHAMYGRPVLVTEFAVADWTATTASDNRYTADEVETFMNEVCDHMDRTPWVRGYAWYPWGRRKATIALYPSIFFDLNGNLTQLGRAYASRA